MKNLIHSYDFVCSYRGFDIYYDERFNSYCYRYGNWFRESSSWDLIKVKQLIDKRVSEKGFSFDLLDVS